MCEKSIDTLSGFLDALFSRLGEEPPLPIQEVKPALANWFGVVDSVKAEIEAFETRLREMEANSKDAILAKQIDLLEAQLHEAREEIERLKYDLAQIEKKESELTPDRLRILNYLPNSESAGLTLGEIANGIRILPDEVVVHLGILKGFGFASCGLALFNRGKVWNRTLEGDELVVAKR